MTKLRLIIIINAILIFSSCSLLSYNLVNPYEQLERNGVPVFYLHPKPISKDYYSPVTVIFNGETYEAEGKIRGGQTALYPKKSYTLKFSDDKLLPDPFFQTGDPDYMDRKKIVLTANFDEHSHIRNRLAYWFWNQMGNNYTIKSTSAEVFTNGSYEGLYTVAEFIDETFIERNNLASNSIPIGGELFKGSTNDVKFFLTDDTLAGFEKKTGYPEEGDDGAFDSLEDFITNIRTLVDSDFATYFTNNADDQEYYDWWFLVSFLQAWDSYGKNSYHYLPPGSGEKWHYIPWDFNASFGQSWNTEREENDFDETYVDFQGIFDRLIENSSFKTDADLRYSSLLSTPTQLTKADILAKVDSLKAEIETAAEADYEKWNEIYRNHHVWDHRSDFTTFNEEILYIRTWISDQHDLFTLVWP